MRGASTTRKSSTITPLGSTAWAPPLITMCSVHHPRKEGVDPEYREIDPYSSSLRGGTKSTGILVLRITPLAVGPMELLFKNPLRAPMTMRSHS